MHTEISCTAPGYAGVVGSGCLCHQDSAASRLGGGRIGWRKEAWPNLVHCEASAHPYGNGRGLAAEEVSTGEDT